MGFVEVAGSVNIMFFVCFERKCLKSLESMAIFPETALLQYISYSVRFVYMWNGGNNSKSVVCSYLSQ